MSPENNNSTMRLSDYNRGAEPLFSVMGTAGFSEMSNSVQETKAPDSTGRSSSVPSFMKFGEETGESTRSLLSILESAVDLLVDEEMDQVVSFQMPESISVEEQLSAVSISSSSTRSSFKSTDEAPNSTALPSFCIRANSPGMPRAA
mmetsp:Transcript_21016/g.29669  ORF Transcript_21016/g.29669 Transcript_21016/m.29669 type:complete len:147 (+) Transcript_21016:239-679(+)